MESSKICLAIKKLKKFDILLLAGKGHEQYQEIKGERYFLDDKEVVLKAINIEAQSCL